MSKRPQTIFRAAAERPYTAISSEFLQNPDVTYDVKGLVAELLSRPRGADHVKRWPRGTPQ